MSKSGSDDESAMIRSQDNQPLLSSSTCAAPSGAPFFCSARYNLALLSCFGISVAYALRVNLSVALVAMVNDTESIPKVTNSAFLCPMGSDPSRPLPGHGKGHHYRWNSKEQGLLLGAFFYGYIITQVPGGYLAGRVGSKLPMGLGIGLTALLSLVTPIAASFGLPCIFAVRFLQGLGEGVTFPSMHAMWSHWAPPFERSRLMTISYVGTNLGTVVSLPLSGILAEYWGWPSIFYVFGCIGLVWMVLWFIFAWETPEQHPSISIREQDYIADCIGDIAPPGWGQGANIPWISIFTSLRLWAIIVAHFCYNWTFYTLLTMLPTYMDSVLHFNIKQNGLLSALPYLLGWLMTVTGGQLADLTIERNILSVTNTRKVFTALGMVLPAVFLVAVTFGGCDHVLAVTFLALSNGIGGLCGSGFSINHLDIAPGYAGLLLGITNTFATIPGFIGPALARYLTPNNLLQEWRTVFCIAAGIDVFGALFFSIFGSGKVQSWAVDEDAPRPHVH
uniref:sialin-like isoform X1 n=2 Tax=Myxine glutinosa TaxID=7769 RepID=UPI00358F4804